MQYEIFWQGMRYELMHYELVYCSHMRAALDRTRLLPPIINLLIMILMGCCLRMMWNFAVILGVDQNDSVCLLFSLDSEIPLTTRA